MHLLCFCRNEANLQLVSMTAGEWPLLLTKRLFVSTITCAPSSDEVSQHEGIPERAASAAL